ncbi:MAG: sodium/solute symporter [Planctomyces sp.]|nr:sodium/solute symporter [Planctomyces sp.]
MLSSISVLTVPDYIVVVAYLILTIWIGLKVGSKVKTGEDFFLGGRRLPWWAIGASLVATDIGGTDIIGAGGLAYRHGLAVANFEWIGCVPAMIVGAFVFIPFFYRTGVYTVPEFLERRYSGGVRSVIGVCWLIFMACNLGVMLLASGKMMSTVFGWDPLICILITAALVGFYTCTGGLEAVVYTDVLQCVIMIAGCLLILVLGLVRVGGVDNLMTKLREAEIRESANTSSTSGATSDSTATATDAEASTDPNDPQSVTDRAVATDEEIRRTQLILPLDTKTPFPWAGIYFGLALILSPAYWIGNQAIVQRSLGARSEFEAKASYVWGALLKNVIPLIVAIPGLIAVALLPDLKDGDMAVPALVGHVLPAGARGLFVAAFLAALMSSVDSYLNSAATLVSHDFYRRFINPSVSDQAILRVGRITTVVLVIWAIGFAMALAQLQDGSGVYTVFQTLMSFFQGPAFAILLTGIFWRRATATAALIALCSGIATAVGLFLCNQPYFLAAVGWEPLFRIADPFLYYSIWSFLVTIVLMFLISPLTAPISKTQADLFYGAKAGVK